MGLGEPGVGGHLSAGLELGTGQMTHRFLPSTFPSIRPTTGLGHICSDSLGSMLEIASMPHHAKTFRLLHPGFKVHGPGLGSSGLWENVFFHYSSCIKSDCILSRVKQITSPRCMHETSARAWCTGKTQRDRVEWEVGGGIRMGNTCKSMADSCQCMTKPSEMLWSN